MSIDIKVTSREFAKGFIEAMEVMINLVDRMGESAKKSKNKLEINDFMYIGCDKTLDLINKNILDILKEIEKKVASINERFPLECDSINIAISKYILKTNYRFKKGDERAEFIVQINLIDSDDCCAVLDFEEPKIRIIESDFKLNRNKE